MMVHEVIFETSAPDKLTGVMFKAIKRKKNNPKNSKTTKMDSFIDVFHGIGGYDSPGKSGKGFQI